MGKITQNFYLYSVINRLSSMKKIISLALPTLALFATAILCCSATGQLGSRTFKFEALPQNLEELESMEIDRTDPYFVSAMTVAALARFGESQADCFAMLNWLKGPDPMTLLEKTQIRDRLMGKTYKVWSFFRGSSPDNGYTPTEPYRITVTSNSYSFKENGWATLYLKSNGADSPRPIKLRQKKSTQEWFLNSINFLADIRKPAEDDPWN